MARSVSEVWFCLLDWLNDDFWQELVRNQITYLVYIDVGLLMVEISYESTSTWSIPSIGFFISN